jgi:hypothetical protein
MLDRDQNSSPLERGAGLSFLMSQSSDPVSHLPARQTDQLCAGCHVASGEIERGRHEGILRVFQRAGMHDLRLASQIANEVVFLEAGVVVETGPAGEVFGNPRRERTKRYIATLRQQQKAAGTA